MTTTFVTKAARQNRLRLILSGIQKNFSGVTTITLGGTAVALADFTKKIQADIDASDTSVNAKAQLAEDVQAEQASHADLDPELRLFKFFVIAQFGDTTDASTKLADFGFAPRKTATTSLAVKTLAAEKTAATRAARNTMGPKQKAKVKGTIAPATPVEGTQPTTAPTGGTTPPKPGPTTPA
ncbi:MAG TPA: hypothetical protein VGL81_21960 [Polyangiaceae bacterium]|jgi:hypothetical protein